MSSGPAEVVQVSVRRYFMVFGALLSLTALSVAVTQLPVAGRLTIVAAFAIATLQASLVAMTLMHVRKEGVWIYGVVLFTLFVVVNLLFWPAWGHYERAQFF